MKYAIASEHRDFFRKQGSIEFEGLLTAEQLHALNTEITSVLSQRLKITPPNVKRESSQRLFMGGHNLWRDSVAIKKLIWQQRFAEIASELVEQKPVRIGYDQYFPSPSRFGLDEKESREYADLLAKELSLEEVTSLQGVLCGLMLCLDAPLEAPVAESEPVPGDVFSIKAGNGIFIGPETVIAFDRLKALKNNRYLLLTYAQLTTIYIHRENDPHTHALKRLDYVYGDKLRDKTNPIIYR